MKYKLIGSFNIVIGLLEMILPSAMYFFVVPRLLEMYESLNVAEKVPQIIYWGFAFMFFYGLANLIIGIQLFRETDQKDSYLTYGVVLNILNFIFGGLFIGLMIIGLIAPIYQISGAL